MSSSILKRRSAKLSTIFLLFISSSHSKHQTIPKAIIPFAFTSPSSSSFFTSSSSSSSFSYQTNKNINSSLKMAHMDSPSAQRNKGPIWSILQNIIQNHIENDNHSLQVLEVAAGVGVHTMHFTTQIIQQEQEKENPIRLKWYPSDPDESSRNAIEDRVSSCTDSNIKNAIHVPPLSLTLMEDGIVEDKLNNNECSNIIQNDTIDLITCINMIHISPWEATIGLFHVAEKKLKKGGILYCYGPYKVNGTAVESNLNFDASLKARDESWGVRDLELVEALANENGFVLEEKIEMPANNLSLIFRKQ